MKDCCKILGLQLMAEILTLFINVTLAFSGSSLLRLICSFCTVGILVGLSAQGGYLAGVSDRKILRKQPDAVPKGKVFLLALTAMLPAQICWLLLLLSRMGVLADDVYRVYKLLAAPFLQVCNLFSDGLLTSGLPVAGFVVLELLTLLPAVGTWTAYQLTISGKRMEDRMY